MQKDSPLHLPITAPQPAPPLTTHFTSFQTPNHTHSYFANLTKHISVPFLPHVHFSHLTSELNVESLARIHTAKKQMVHQKEFVHKQISPQDSQ